MSATPDLDRHPPSSKAFTGVVHAHTAHDDTVVAQKHHILSLHGVCNAFSLCHVHRQAAMNADGGLGQTGDQDKHQIFEQGQKALKSYTALLVFPSSIHRLLNMRNSGKNGKVYISAFDPKRVSSEYAITGLRWALVK